MTRQWTGSRRRQPPTGGRRGTPRRRAARRTVSAYRDGDRTVVLIPARMSRAEEREWVTVMLERLARQDAKLRPSDNDLLARARDAVQALAGRPGQAASACAG